ncbi:hypothetical protein SDC9_135456 [bioreactor metagenome]|uniref:Uncharacterized protein n=1 Tax=bioreactor metagenome TaxID=1076179 RepID=A0A645DFW7_9ZZZZ
MEQRLLHHLLPIRYQCILGDCRLSGLFVAFNQNPDDDGCRLALLLRVGKRCPAENLQRILRLFSRTDDAFQSFQSTNKRTFPRPVGTDNGGSLDDLQLIVDFNHLRFRKSVVPDCLK